MTAPSILDLVEQYLVFRRGLGFDLESPRWMLRDFARHADRIGHQGHVTIDLAVQWALSSRSNDPAQAARRLSAVRQFARHRAVLDPDTEIPPIGLLGRVERRKQPHIYSDAEVAALLRQARVLRPHRHLSQGNHAEAARAFEEDFAIIEEFDVYREFEAQDRGCLAEALLGCGELERVLENTVVELARWKRERRKEAKAKKAAEEKGKRAASSPAAEIPAALGPSSTPTNEIDA